MSFSVLPAFIAFVCITWPVNVLAVPFISVVILQNQSDNNLTLVCEVDDRFKPKVTMSAGDEVLAVVNRNNNVVSAHQLLEDSKIKPEVDTFGEYGLHIALAIPRSYYGQGLTCSSTISSSMFRFQTNFEKFKSEAGTREPPPDELGINVNPAFLDYSSDTHKRVSAQFLCTTNFESSASEPFTWSLVGKNSGQELLVMDLGSLMKREMSLEVNISRKESILTIEGLDFPSIPDDIIVTCSSRLSDDDDPVSSSSTIRIGQGGDNQDKVIIGLSVAVGLLSLFFLVSWVVICLLCRICERKGKQHQQVEQDRQNVDYNIPEQLPEQLSSLGNSPDVTNVPSTNLELQPPSTNDEARVEHFPSIHSYENIKSNANRSRNEHF